MAHPSPPGKAAGGQWGTTTYVGPITWGLAIASLYTIIGWIIVLLFCPSDQRDVYKIDNKLYLADGTYYKPATEHNFAIQKSCHVLSS